jgi:hypothetical protein
LFVGKFTYFESDVLNLIKPALLFRAVAKVPLSKVV